MAFFKAPKPTQPVTVAVPSLGPGRQRGLYIDRRPQAVAEPSETAIGRDDLVDGPPVGRLFAASGGYFDSRGFWVVRKGKAYEVRRGAPRKVLGLLSEEQKRVLRAAQQRARKQDLR